MPNTPQQPNDPYREPVDDDVTGPSPEQPKQEKQQKEPVKPSPENVPPSSQQPTEGVQSPSQERSVETPTNTPLSEEDHGLTQESQPKPVKPAGPEKQTGATQPNHTPTQEGQDMIVPDHPLTEVKGNNEQVASTPETPPEPQEESEPTTMDEGSNAVSEPEKGNIPHIRTFESDASEALKAEQMSSASIAVKEAEKHGEGVKSVSFATEGRKAFNIILILILMVATAGLLLYVTVINPSGQAPLYSEENPDELFFVNARTEINAGSFSPNDLRNTLIALTSDLNLTVEQVAHVYFIQGEGGLRRFLEVDEMLRLLDLRAPTSLERTFEDDYMIGYYGGTERNEPFILFTIRDFDIAFSGALSWEQTMMNDLGYLAAPIATQSPVETDDAETTATTPENSTTSAAVTPATEPLREGFVDEVIQNIDVRLYESGGATQLLYAFPNRQTLLITTSEEAFEEIIQRLTRARFTR